MRKSQSNFLFFALIISLLIILFSCFLAGWVASKGVGKAIVHWLENNLLVLFHGYHWMKSTMETKVVNVVEKEFPIVLIPGDGWQFGFLVEDLPK